VDAVAERIFISHTGSDSAWAEWVRAKLEEEGRPTELDSAAWGSGDNFIEAMDRALGKENPLLVLLSRAYLGQTRFTTDEWTTRFAQRRRDPRAKLIALRLEDVDLSGGIWAPIITYDLFGIDEDAAKKVLLKAVLMALDPEAARRLPSTPPPFPGGPAPKTGPLPPARR
jgi:hypothetical protein